MQQINYTGRTCDETTFNEEIINLQQRVFLKTDMHVQVRTLTLVVHEHRLTTKRNKMCIPVPRNQ